MPRTSVVSEQLDIQFKLESCYSNVIMNRRRATQMALAVAAVLETQMTIRTSTTTVYVVLNISYHRLGVR